jgi:hypothetical protein
MTTWRFYAVIEAISTLIAQTDWSEVIGGSLLLGLFLVTAYVVGSAIRKRKMAKYGRALAPHAALVGGKVTGDPEFIWIEGNFRGRKVTLGVSPAVEDGVTSRSRTCRAFEITLKDVDGIDDWSVEYRRTLALDRRWQVRTENSLMKEWLQSSSLIAELQSVGIDCWLRYDLKGRWLRSRMEVEQGLVAPVERVREQLDLLLRIATEFSSSPAR